MHWLVLVFLDCACVLLLPSENSRDGGSKVFSARTGFLRKTKSSENFAPKFLAPVGAASRSASSSSSELSQSLLFL
jgi:hypothetical protein